MPTPQSSKRPQLLPVRSRAAGSQPDAVSAAVSEAVTLLSYVSDSLNSAADTMLLEVQLGRLESVIEDSLQPAIRSLIELREELVEIAPS